MTRSAKDEAAIRNDPPHVQQALCELAYVYQVHPRAGAVLGGLVHSLFEEVCEMYGGAA